ncbi:hypothetical protein ACQKLP_26235 [Chitinophaga sp. NPDC101104]|uniref:hypothetical protein n=1 Tax=Chitinophaga sp. NPDC101104 TaxID=3390561 RepID=UPI003D083D08
MLSRLLPLCLGAIVLYSCKKSEHSDQLPTTRVDSMLVMYTKQYVMVSPVPGPVLVMPKYALHFSLEHITRRVGVVVPGSLPGSYIFDQRRYEKVSYEKDSIVIGTYVEGQDGPPTSRRKYLLDKGNVWVRVRYSDATGLPTDTAWYYFKTMTKLDRIEWKNGNILTRNTFQHDRRGNVHTSTAETYIDGKLVGQGVTQYLEYDDKINPVKGVVLFEDMLERGQSENNALRINAYGWATGSGGGMSRYQSTESIKYFYDGRGRADLSKPPRF